MKELEQVQRTPVTEASALMSHKLLDKENGSTVQLGEMTQTMTQDSHIDLMEQT